MLRKIFHACCTFTEFAISDNARMKLLLFIGMNLGAFDATFLSSVIVSVTCPINIATADDSTLGSMFVMHLILSAQPLVTLPARVMVIAGALGMS